MHNEFKKTIRGLALLAICGFLFSMAPVAFADHDDDDDDDYRESYYEYSRNYYDDDEYEHDEWWEFDDDDDYYEYAPQEAVSQTTPNPRTLDSDGDTIVDQYDRYPNANDLLYTTDSDGDGILDVNDRHPGENDFIYLIEDGNTNGIADDLERALGLF